ncbi:hypothetical protein PSCICF_40450 [Pseudomonas cichorii]|nr:hypothetical protein PSCICF_40450 [Pseudomonas cichorii]GFM60393.1 hypothetical protein PSCICG_15530 [Pseudomonas cichorii]
MDMIDSSQPSPPGHPPLVRIARIEVDPATQALAHLQNDHIAAGRIGPFAKVLHILHADRPALVTP